MDTRINLTDRDAKLHKVSGRIVPAYNAQASVDEDHQVITSCHVTTDPDDIDQLIPGIEGVQDNLGKPPEIVAADGGYFSGENLDAVEAIQTDVYIPDSEQARQESMPPEKERFHKSHFTYDEQQDFYICPLEHKLPFYKSRPKKRKNRTIKVRVYRGIACDQCPSFDQCRQNKQAKARTIHRSPHEHVLLRHRKKMNTDQSKALYSIRKFTVEPTFGNIKHNLGLKSFSLRGLLKVSGEFALMCSAHNLLKFCSQAACNDEAWLASQLAGLSPASP